METPTLKIGDTLTSKTAKQLRVGDRVLNALSGETLLVDRVRLRAVSFIVTGERDDDPLNWFFENPAGWSNLTLVSRGPEYDKGSPAPEPETKSPPIEIMVPESKRMEALLECARALRILAASLAEGATQVSIGDCSFSNCGCGVEVTTDQTL